MNCPKCEGEMWDNRDRKTNPKAPDFKCKDKNCDGVIWPPRNGKTAAKAPQSPQNAPGRVVSSDERSNRIERQHSQEMAIRYAALKGLDALDTTELRKLVDWFQRDVGRMPSDPIVEQAKVIFNAEEAPPDGEDHRDQEQTQDEF